MKAIEVEQGKYAIFCDNGNFIESVNLADLKNNKADLENQNSEMDIGNDDDALLQWAKDNFYYYGDGEIVTSNNKHIEKLTALIDLIEGN